MSPKLLAAGSLAALAIISPALAQTKGPDATETPLPRTQFMAGMDGEFRKMDADKNGQLTRTEIEQYQKAQAVAQAAARNRALFAQLDADKNGQLSKAEFAKIATPAPAANAQPIFASRDLNRDGQIGLIEHRTATVANFDRLDSDKDGYVTAAEMKAGGITPP